MRLRGSYDGRPEIIEDQHSTLSENRPDGFSSGLSVFVAVHQSAALQNGWGAGLLPWEKREESSPTGVRDHDARWTLARPLDFRKH